MFVTLHRIENARGSPGAVSLLVISFSVINYVVRVSVRLRRPMLIFFVYICPMKRFILPALAAIVIACAPKVKDADSEYAKDLIKPGEAIPEFSIPSAADSTLVSNADVAGQYLVLDFWATWCPDCRADVPAVKELYAKYGDKVRFVGISFDTDKEALDKYLAENEIPWLQLSDFAGKKESSIGENFHVKWIPSMYLIDPEGKVVLGTVMVDKLAAALEKL